LILGVVSLRLIFQCSQIGNGERGMAWGLLPIPLIDSFRGSLSNGKGHKILSLSVYQEGTK